MKNKTETLEIYQKKFGSDKGKFGFRSSKTHKEYGDFYDEIQIAAYTTLTYNNYDRDDTVAVKNGEKWSILSLKDFKCYGEYDAILPTNSRKPFQQGYACVKIAGAWYFLKESDFKNGKLILRSPFEDGGCDRVDRGFDHGKTLVWKNGETYYITGESLELETEKKEFVEWTDALMEQVTEGMSETESGIVKNSMKELCIRMGKYCKTGSDFSNIQNGQSEEECNEIV